MEPAGPNHFTYAHSKFTIFRLRTPKRQDSRKKIIGPAPSCRASGDLDVNGLSCRCHRVAELAFGSWKSRIDGSFGVRRCQRPAINGVPIQNGSLGDRSQVVICAVAAGGHFQTEIGDKRTFSIEGFCRLGSVKLQKTRIAKGCSPQRSRRTRRVLAPSSHSTPNRRGEVTLDLANIPTHKTRTTHSETVHVLWLQDDFSKFRHFNDDTISVPRSIPMAYAPNSDDRLSRRGRTSDIRSGRRIR